LKKWNYITVGLDGTKPILEDRLKYWGEEGWELVSVDDGVAYFKKELEECIDENQDSTP
jgi:hypothetical protein